MFVGSQSPKKTYRSTKYFRSTCVYLFCFQNFKCCDMCPFSLAKIFTANFGLKFPYLIDFQSILVFLMQKHSVKLINSTLS